MLSLYNKSKITKLDAGLLQLSCLAARTAGNYVIVFLVGFQHFGFHLDICAYHDPTSSSASLWHLRVHTVIHCGDKIPL